jgi:hypothetical protein
MTDHTEYRPLRARHWEALIRQELRRLAATDGRLHKAARVPRSTAGSRPASTAVPLEQVSVADGHAGVLTGP